MVDATLFRSKAPQIMRQLMADFSLTDEDAAAILGNIGHECGGFHLFQEQKPMVAGSRGGFGWCQWTGPRRREFEGYVKRNNLDPKSDKANYGWLFVELSTTEKGAIPATRSALGLKNKVEAFERHFERAGVKHYDERMRWAEIALEEFRSRPVHPSPVPSPPPIVQKPANAGAVGAGAGIAGVLAAAVVGFLKWMGWF